MADAPEPPTRSAAERRIVSVLFADLVGFTPLSERLDSEDVATIQDAYFAAVRETIQRYGGVLEKFIGDAAMAAFGIPRALDDDAERAVRAGLALIGAVEQLGARLGLEPGELQVRVGVNSGEVVHATDGPDAGRVTGDTVNTAARFQAAADPGTVLIGELTALAVADAIEAESIGRIELKGKAQPIPAWRAIGVRPHPSRELAMGSLRAPMLGRAAEMDRLLAAAARCAETRRADRITVIAPPGVGKSRLLAEFATIAPFTVLRARVRPQATAPYDTVAQLFAGLDVADLTDALARAGVPAARARVVEHEVARLTDASTPATGGGGDLAAERDARFDAWLEALDALLAAPNAWLVEDVHWAGPDLLAFLDRAGSAGSPHGRLVVATSRPSLLETAPEWCGSERIDLVPLPAADARALIGALVGDALPPDLADAIVERSDGTPLFIEELLRTWVSVGVLVPDGDGWRLAVEPGSVSLPPTVQAIYAAQLDDLPPDARAVARRGSVAGRRVPVAALEPLELGDQRSGLDVLHRRALLAGPVDDPIGGDSYAYRHALLRDAGYASLARAERARLHLAMAGWLQAIAADRTDVIAEAVAEHYASALDARPALATDLPDRDELAARAASWYERAAEAALALSAHEAAERMLLRAIELSDGAAASLDLARRRLRRGQVLASSAHLGAGIAELEAARAAAEGDPELTAAATFALGRAFMEQMRFAEVERLTAETLAALEGEPATTLARLHALHAWAVGAQGRGDGVVEEANLADAAARAGGDPLLELEVLQCVAAARDEVDATMADDWGRLEELGRRLGRWEQVAAASRIRAMYVGFEDPAAAVQALEEAWEVADAHGLREQAGWADYARCETLWVLDRLDEALAAGLRVVEVAERYAYERLAFRTYVVLLAIGAVRRDPSIADAYGRWSAPTRDHFPTTPSPYARVLQAGIAAWIARARGDDPPAADADLLDAIVPMVNAHYLAALETAVEAWSHHGRHDLVAEAAARMAAIAEQPDATTLMRASAALIAGHAGDAAAALRAAELASAIPAPWWERRARVLCATRGG